VKLTDFKPTDRDDLLRTLDPVNQARRPVALGNQTNPLIVRLRTTPRVWWVNQGTSFRRARDGGYLWAPVADKNGRMHDHWRAMRRLRPGDFIINYANTRVRAWSLATSTASPATRPDPSADQVWAEDGYRAVVTYHDVSPPVDLAEIPIEWRRYEGGPFTKDGGVKQGYLFPLSDKFAARLRAQFSRLAIPLGDTAPSAPDPVAVDDGAEALDISELTVDAVMRAVADRGLRIRPDVIAQLVAAICSGKHVILTGPPGTAKTTLAELVGSVAAAAGVCSGYLLTTATADWTTYETIGGLKPDAKHGLAFQERHFLDAIRNDEWLVIDELNRSNFDRAFGQLFTVSGQAVELPYERELGAGRVALVPAGATHGFVDADVLEIPASWRVVATMNVFDKSLLFEMSFALMRRFAFVEVPSPPQNDFEALIDEQVQGDTGAAQLAEDLLRLRSL
jgi:MoxR-like ATPase